MTTNVQIFHFEKILIYLTRSEMFFLEKIFCKKVLCQHTGRCFVKLLKEVLKNTWRCYAKILRYWSQKSTTRCSVKLLRYMFCKNTKRCSENILRGFRQTTDKHSAKNTERCSAKNIIPSSVRILKNALQKYWGVFHKNIERCSTKLHRGVLNSDTKWTTLSKLTDLICFLLYCDLLL